MSSSGSLHPTKADTLKPHADILFLVQPASGEHGIETTTGLQCLSKGKWPTYRTREPGSRKTPYSRTLCPAHVDFEQCDIGADADVEPDTHHSFEEGVGLTAGCPWPLAINPSWLLATSWLLLAASNLCIQHRVHDYLTLTSVLLRAAVTIGCAPCATEFYDY